MTVRKLVDRIFRRYGAPVVVITSYDYVTIYGFAEHTATSARKYVLPEHSPLGELPRGHYLMLLPLTLVLKPGDSLMYSNHWYVVRRAEKVYFRDEALYYCCLCEEKGEPDLWGT